MVTLSIMMYLVENFHINEFQDKRILEVGSKYVNGSVRPIVEKFLTPKEYIGVDIEPGKFVDKVLPAENIVKYFHDETFDVVISTEVLEHVKDWRIVINNLKQVLKKGGHLYISTRSKGFRVHGYPFDFWRYQIEDMKQIFSDFQIISLKKDRDSPGIFLKAIKPLNYKPNMLEDIELYSIILDEKTKAIPEIGDSPSYRRLKLIISKFREKINKIPFPVRIRYVQRK